MDAKTDVRLREVIALQEEIEKKYGVKFTMRLTLLAVDIVTAAQSVGESTIPIAELVHKLVLASWDEEKWQAEIAERKAAQADAAKGEKG